MPARIFRAVSLTLLLGTAGAARAGDGPLFAAPFLSFDTQEAPSSVAIGDLNGDGRQDLAVANNGSNSVSVLLGSGGGLFGTRADYGTGAGPHAVAIGDLNGDGHADLAVANGSSNTGSV